MEELQVAPGGHFLLTAHFEVTGWPASSYTGPCVCMRATLSVGSALSQSGACFILLLLCHHPFQLQPLIRKAQSKVPRRVSGNTWER